jgi:hypothetical protein
VITLGDELKVDTSQLADLGSQLAGVRDKLEQTGALVDTYQASIVSADVLAAVRGFDGHWGRGRRQIKEKADALASMLVDAAASYVQVDADLGDALTTDGSTVSATGH